jgi:predicted enzyme related to lactoylglutathione lyase
MLKLSSVMIGTSQPKALRDFYEKVFAKKPDMVDGSWAGWSVGNCFFSVGEHSEVKGKAKEPERILFNLETDDVKGEFKRITEIGAEVVKEPYEMGESWIATLADPDGNYFQLMTPWKS